MPERGGNGGLHPALRLGTFEVLQANDKLLVVLRHVDDDDVLCAFNFSEEAVTASLPRSWPTPAQNLTLGRVDLNGQQLTLGPWAALMSPLASATDNKTDSGSR